MTRGEFSVSAAAEIVKALPVDEQRKLVLEVAKSDYTKRAFADSTFGRETLGPGNRCLASVSKEVVGKQ
jgi:hypothetical protein